MADSENLPNDNIVLCRQTLRKLLFADFFTESENSPNDNMVRCRQSPRKLPFAYSAFLADSENSPNDHIALCRQTLSKLPFSRLNCWTKKGQQPCQNSCHPLYRG